MLGLVLVLLLYSVAITIAVIVTTASKDKYYKKYRALEDELRRIKASGNVPAPQVLEQATKPAAPAPAPVPVPAPAPVPAAAPTSVQAPRPVPAPAQVPLPTYSYHNTAPRKEKSGPTAVGVSFSVGVLLMVIAAAVFISATWQTMLPVFKCIVLLMVVAGVYAISTLSRKKLKLEKTSSVLYMLGSLITPLAVFVGFLAFDVRETLITLVCCALSLGISGLIGYRIFGSKLQVAISYLGFVWSEIFICMQLMGNLNGMAFGMCLAAFVSGLIYYIRPKLKFFNIFAEVTAYVAVIGFFMSTAFGERELALLLVSQLMYWVSLIMLTRRRHIISYFSAAAPVFTLLALYIATENRTVFAIVSICAMVALLAIYKLIKHENVSSNAIICAGIAVLMKIIDEPFLTLEHPYDFLRYACLIVPVISFAYVIITSKFKAERAVYWYLEFLALIMLSAEFIKGTVPVMIFLAVAVASCFANFKYKQIHLQFASLAASVFVLITNLNSQNTDVVSVIYGSVMILVYGAVVFINKFKTVDKNVFMLAKYSLLAPVVLSNLILLVRTFAGNDISFAAIVVMDIIFTVITLYDVDNYAGLVPVMTFTIAVMFKLVVNDVNTAFISAVFVAVYVIIGRIFVCEKLVGKNRIDWFTCVALLCCFFPVLDWSSSMIIITFYILSFIGRFGEEGATVEEKIKSKLRIILSAATGSFAVCMATLDVELSSVMDLEIRLMIMLIAALLIYIVIRPGSAARWIWFSTVAASIEIEALHALSAGNLLPLTLISICSIGIFIYSFIGKKRSWFILSIASIFQFALLFALVFWESRLWWIYLLVIGGILIATASTNEYKRRRAIESGLEDKKIRLFEDWTW